MPKLFVKPYSQDELDPSKMGVYAFEITPVYFKGISDAPAQHQIGWYFYTGFKKTYWDYGDINHDNPQISVYIKPNIAQSVEWWTKAANNGNHLAQYHLGLLYLLGEGVDKNLDEAVSWLNQAIEAGIEEAEIAAGLLLEERGKKELAVKAYTKLVQKGNPDALILLKNLKVSNDILNLTRENDLLDSAAKNIFQGDIGFRDYFNNYKEDLSSTRLYLHHPIVQDAYFQAVKYYRFCSNYGDLYSQNALGWIYENGIGVSKDLNKSIEFYTQASDNNSPDAKFHLSKLLKLINPEQAEIFKSEATKLMHPICLVDNLFNESDPQEELIDYCINSGSEKARFLKAKYSHDDDSEMYWLKKSAASGSSSACSLLIERHVIGRYGHRDYINFDKARELVIHCATYNLKRFDEHYLNKFMDYEVEDFDPDNKIKITLANEFLPSYTLILISRLNNNKEYEHARQLCEQYLQLMAEAPKYNVWIESGSSLSSHFLTYMVKYYLFRCGPKRDWNKIYYYCTESLKYSTSL